MKHHIQSLLNKFRAVFAKKKGTSSNPADASSTDKTPNETTRLADGGSMSRSSSKSTVKSKPTAPSADREMPQAWARSQSLERPDDIPAMASESTSMPSIMPQLPTILVGEVMDSEHLPRDEQTIEQDIMPA